MGQTVRERVGRIPVTLWVLAISCLIVGGCGRGIVPATGSGIALVYGCGNDAATLDPADAEDGESSKVIDNVFETLVNVSDDGKSIEPSLAVKWTESDDHREWTFELRPNVEFHDGTPFNADSVVFTFGRLLDLNSPYRFGAKLPYRSSFDVIHDVKAVDAHTVVFRLREPSAVLLRNLAMFSASIVSPEAVKRDGENFRIRPVGTGPFAFDFWDRDQKIVLSRYDGYWGTLPRIGQVIFKPVSEPAARLRQLQSGELDMADNLSIPVLMEARHTPGIRVLSIPGFNTAYLAMNNERPPFNNITVRRAIAHAIDKKAIVASAFDGQARIATTLVPSSMWGYDPNVQNYPYDPDLARMLLEEAGVEPGTKVGLWVMTNSRPYMPTPDRVAAIVQQQLRAVGLEPQIQSPPWIQFLEQVSNGEASLALFGWQSDNADPDNFLFELLDLSNAEPPNAHNISFYRSDKVHELLKAAQTTADPAERLRLYAEAQLHIREDCPLVPLVHVDQSVAMRDAVSGYQLNPSGRVWLAGVTVE